MLSENDEINGIKREIVVIERDIANLIKMLDKKKSYKTLTRGEETDLKHEIADKKEIVQELEAEIRKIQNTEIRAKNLSAGGLFE